MSCKPERKKEGRWVGGGRRSGSLPKDRFFALDRWAVQRGRPEVFWRDGIQETKREGFPEVSSMLVVRGERRRGGRGIQPRKRKLDSCMESSSRRSAKVSFITLRIRRRTSRRILYLRSSDVYGQCKDARSVEGTRARRVAFLFFFDPRPLLDYIL